MKSSIGPCRESTARKRLPYWVDTAEDPMITEKIFEALKDAIIELDQEKAEELVSGKS